MVSGESMRFDIAVSETPLKRFYCDMHLHMLHGRRDIAARIIEASELGEPFDLNRNH